MIGRRGFMVGGGACLGAGLLGTAPREVPAWIEVFCFGGDKPLPVPVRFSAPEPGVFTVRVLDEHGGEFARCDFDRRRVEEALRGASRVAFDRVRCEGAGGTRELPCRLRGRRGKLEVQIVEDGQCLVAFPADRVREALGEGAA